MDADREDLKFEPRVGRLAREKGSNLARLRTAVRIATPVRGKGQAPTARTGQRAHFAKGGKAMHGVTARAALAGQRRVVVKARYVAHGSGKGAPLRVHVSYLAREARAASRGVRDDQPEPGADGLSRSVDYLEREKQSPGDFAFYNQQETGVDAKAVTSRWKGDARHFRLIISAEDGEALRDLRPFIREIMDGVERRTGATLEWVAVDHHDTDNPHTHVLIRGRRADGQDLFIPSRVLSSGIREHAQAIATRVLGPRRTVGLERDHQREIRTRAVTPLDRELIRQARGGLLIPGTRPDLAARLVALEGWGLAERQLQGWRLEDDLIGKLQSLEAHATVENAVAGLRRHGERRELLAAQPAAHVEGELAFRAGG